MAFPAARRSRDSPRVFVAALRPLINVTSYLNVSLCMGTSFIAVALIPSRHPTGQGGSVVRAKLLLAMVASTNPSLCLLEGCPPFCPLCFFTDGGPPSSSEQPLVMRQLLLAVCSCTALMAIPAVLGLGFASTSRFPEVRHSRGPDSGFLEVRHSRKSPSAWPHRSGL